MGLRIDISRYPKATSIWRKVYISRRKISVISNSMSRRFRWTDLQIKRLRDCPTAKGFRNALDTIPKSLEETYHRALETIPDENREDVRRVLIWLTSSFRELTSSEVAAAIEFPFAEDVLKICKSVLVTVIDGGPQETIKLAHFTVKEFLIVQKGFEVGLKWYQFSARFANRCVTAQAAECIFGCPPAGSKNLIQYSRQFWLAHARHIPATTDFAECDEVQPSIDYLFDVENRKRLTDGLRGQFPDEVSFLQDDSQPSQSLYYASLLGLKRSVAQVWKNCSQLRQREGFYGNALDAAACMGHVEVVMWLTDRIENPSGYFELSRISRYLRVNVSQTLHALLRKGPRPSISTEVVYALTINLMGEDILKILIEEDLASISITEELACTAAHNKWNRKIVEFLVRNRTHEFPVSLRALLTLAGTSQSALQFLIESRRGDIWFNERDYLELVQAKSAHNIEKLVSLGINIPITPELLGILAYSPSGSQILKLLLDTQTIAYPLTSVDVLTVANGFNLETFDSLLRHKWENNTLTEELVLALASNCYLVPPVRPTVPERENSTYKLHRSYRPAIRRSSMQNSDKALISLINRSALTLDLTERIIVLISEHFAKEVILHLVNRAAGIRIFSTNATYNRFSFLLRKHASDLDVSPTILQALNDSYKAIPMSTLFVGEHIFRLDVATTSNKIETSTNTPTAVLLGLKSLPEALQGLNYSTSDYDGKSTIYVQSLVPHDPVPSRESSSDDYDESSIDSDWSDEGMVWEPETCSEILEYLITEDDLRSDLDTVNLDLIAY